MFIFLILVVLTIALAFAPGVGIFALVPAVIALLYLGWFVVLIGSGRTPRWALRRSSHRPELLGPGGPDDPDRDEQ